MKQCYMYDFCNHKDCDKELCVRKYKLDYLYDEAGLPYFHRNKLTLRIDGNGTDLEQFKQLAEIEKNIVNFVDNGQNLYLYSSQSGNGKTSWAVRLVQAYFNAIWAETDLCCRAVFVDVANFLIRLKETMYNRDEEFEKFKLKIREADLVVWDDIANKDGTDYEINQLLAFINDRTMKGKSNIYTANINGKSMWDVLGSRLASRIVNMSTNINLQGADKRNQCINN